MQQVILKNPIHIPSFLPRINPKEDVTTIRRLGEIEAMDRVWKRVLCSNKQIEIIRATYILRLIM